MKEKNKLIESGVIPYEIKNQKVFEGEYYTFDILSVYFNRLSRRYAWCNTLESITPISGIWCNSGVILSKVLHQRQIINIQEINPLKYAKV